jgi:hypothetical protein
MLDLIFNNISSEENNNLLFDQIKITPVLQFVYRCRKAQNTLNQPKSGSYVPIMSWILYGDQ